jgi:glutamyl-tRNA(Gln) amidotransferase subunit E
MKGLKVGLEFHQRLDTHKLFCECSSGLAAQDEKPVRTIARKLRPVAGELGAVDIAARHEFARKKTFHYQCFAGKTCLVETDEEPPHPVNPEATGIALQIAKLLHCDIVDEIYVMRKTVIDGSNTAGFQRTMLIGINGYVDVEAGRVEIPELYLEEESAGIVKVEENDTTYRLDRLGIPLVEIKTGIIEHFTPKQCAEATLVIGRLLRSTGRVQRGLGTIRQDINISIPGGSRVEIKGAQDLKLFETYIEREIQRQRGLIGIGRELKKKPKSDIIDVSSLFKDSKSKILRGKPVFAVKLPGFAGILGTELCSDHRVGTELAHYAMRHGVKGIIHSDENMGKYHISDSESMDLKKTLKLSKEDAFVLVSAPKQTATRALDAVLRRASLLLRGVPKETRRALPNGNTAFMRPLAGASRMYPETDIPPVTITKGMLDSIELPETPRESKKRLKDLGLSDELAARMTRSKHLGLFNRVIFLYRVNPTLIATTLLETGIMLRREGFEIPEEGYIRAFELLERGKLVKEGIPGFLKHGEVREKIPDEEIKTTIKKIISRSKGSLKKPNAFRIIMGETMKELRGKADGKKVAEMVKNEMKKA